MAVSACVETDAFEAFDVGALGGLASLDVGQGKATLLCPLHVAGSRLDDLLRTDYRPGRLQLMVARACLAAQW